MEEGQQPTTLRIAGYVGRPPKHARPDDEGPRLALPNIADYWPDKPGQEDWRGLLPENARQATSGPFPAGPSGRWLQRPVILTGMTALLVVFGTVLLARPLATSEITDRPVAVPTDVIPLEPMPAASPSPSFSFSLPPTVPAASASPPVSPSAARRPRAARLEFVSGVTVLSVRIMDLDGDDYRVSAPSGTPMDAVTTFSGGVLRVDVKSSESGAVEVRLSNRIAWHLRLGAGVKTLNFDATGGTVSRIDLDGGAETMNMHLGKPAGVLPISMTGGVASWFIHTTTRLPVRVAVGSGAGDVTLYGRASGGTGAGTVLTSGRPHDGPSLDIDATGGIGALEIKRR